MALNTRIGKTKKTATKTQAADKIKVAEAFSGLTDSGESTAKSYVKAVLDGQLSEAKAAEIQENWIEELKSLDPRKRAARIREMESAAVAHEQVKSPGTQCWKTISPRGLVAYNDKKALVEPLTKTKLLAAVDVAVYFEPVEHTKLLESILANSVNFQAVGKNATKYRVQVIRAGLNKMIEQIEKGKIMAMPSIVTSKAASGKTNRISFRQPREFQLKIQYLRGQEGYSGMKDQEIRAMALAVGLDLEQKREKREIKARSGK